MSDHDLPDWRALDLPDPVEQLLEEATHWTPRRWSDAIRAAREPLHRERRAVSRSLCEALLTHTQRALGNWLVRDAVTTAVESSVLGIHAGEAAIATELLEDAALALLARPALPLLDLAVLLGPCLPLRSPDNVPHAP